MDKLIYRTLFFNGELISQEVAMPFANSPLHRLDNEAAIALSKERKKRTQIANYANKRAKLFKSWPIKFAQLKIKLFKVLFKHLFLPGKASKSGNIVCLYVDNNVKCTADTPVYAAKPKPLKVFKNTL